MSADPTTQEQKQARAIADEVIGKYGCCCPEYCKRCDQHHKIATTAAAALAKQRERWESVVPEHVGQWADAIVKESGFDESAPLIVMLRQLATMRSK